MNRLRNKIVAILLVAGLLGIGGVAGAMEVVKTPEWELNMRGRMQWFGVAQALQDDFRNDSRLYLFLRQARLGFFGSLDGTRYNIEMAFAGEEGVVTGTPGYALGLLDFSADLPLWDSTYLKVGQFKVPATLEELTGDGSLLFPERSINYLGSRMGRDVGAALVATSGDLRIIAGMFTGGGRDVPERYLPQDLGTPLLAVRMGWDTTKEDPFMRTQEAAGVKEAQSSIYFNALYLRDSLMGHSTVLNVKTSDRSLLLNTNWNPYLAKSPLSKGQFYQVGADAAYQVPMAGGVWSTEIEANVGRAENAYGGVQLAGGRAQSSMTWESWTVGLRYAMLLLDGNFYKGTTQIADTRPIHQVTPTVVFQANRFIKLITSLDILADVPVIMEKNLGAYVATEQPDQTGSGTIGRQNVYEAKMLLQVSF